MAAFSQPWGHTGMAGLREKRFAIAKSVCISNLGRIRGTYLRGQKECLGYTCLLPALLR